MAVVKIKTRGAKAAPPIPAASPKPTRKRSTAKPKSTAKSTTTKRSTAAKPKPTATPAKRGPGRPRKPEGAPVQRRASKGVDPRTEAKLIKLVEKAGERRRKAEIEHKESVNALHAAALEALEEGVSMALVADASKISRQWLYKMGDFAERGTQLRAATNGDDTPAAKPTTRRTRTSAKATPAKRTRATTKTAASPKPKRRTRIRAA